MREFIRGLYKNNYSTPCCASTSTTYLRVPWYVDREMMSIILCDAHQFTAYRPSELHLLRFCVIWSIRPKRILNSNMAKTLSSRTSTSVVKSFGKCTQSTAVILRCFLCCLAQLIEQTFLFLFWNSYHSCKIIILRMIKSSIEEKITLELQRTSYRIFYGWNDEHVRHEIMAVTSIWLWWLVEFYTYCTNSLWAHIR